MSSKSFPSYFQDVWFVIESFHYYIYIVEITLLILRTLCIAGLKEYTVDVHNKQVIMKGDTGKQWKKEDDHSNDEMNNERCQRLKLFLRSFVATCFGNYMAN